MLPSVTAVLRKALRHLEAERQGIDREILAIRAVLGDSGQRRGRTGPPASPRAKVTPPRMSAAARKLIGQRMKVSWAKRKAEAAKGKQKAQK